MSVVPYNNESAKFIQRYGTPPSAEDYKHNPAGYKKAMLAFELPIMILWDIPADINYAIPALPNKLYCNKDLVKPLERALRNYIVKQKAGKLKTRDLIRTFDGCYQVRKVRGSLTSLSRHSWAMAFDVNAAWNGLGVIPQFSEEFVECFTREGFYWGGNFQRKDGMHIELNIDLLPRKK